MEIKSKVNYQEAYRVWTAIIELEESFKETGVHTKIIADYTGISIGRVNAIVATQAFAYFFTVEHMAVDNRYNLLPSIELSGLFENEKKMYSVGFLIKYKEVL